jgi:hypothetical protein
VFDLDAVAMANFIPWGSRTMEALLSELGNEDPAVLRAVLRFADGLNEQIVKALRPRVVVVPFSLARNSEIGDLAKVSASEVSAHGIKLANTRFKFYTGVCQRAGLSVPVLYVPHPASLRLRENDKRRVVGGMAEVLADWNPP